MSPARLLLAWSILRLRHPLIACRISMTAPVPPRGASQATLEAYYRSASFILDSPRSPTEALNGALNSLTLQHGRHSSRKRSEDYVWEYNNGPRTLSPQKLVTFHFARATSSRSDAGVDTAGGGEKRQQYLLFTSQLHTVLDGISTFMLLDEMFSLIGGNSPISSSSTLTAQSVGRGSQESPNVVPRTEAQLRALHHAEWALRYGAASPIHNFLAPPSSSSQASLEPSSSSWPQSGFIPASFEARVAPLAEDAAKHAERDFATDQARLEVCSCLLP